jgi:uncharacterized Zn finger protein (UPF0148 family)
MADITCKKCGYTTFQTYALRSKDGKWICPQCREPYDEDITPSKSVQRRLEVQEGKKFKFKEQK